MVKEKRSQTGGTGPEGRWAGLSAGLGVGGPSPEGSVADAALGALPPPEGEGAVAQVSPHPRVLFPGVPSACKQVVSVETTRDIEWATYTCTLGFHVFGESRSFLAVQT